MSFTKDAAQEAEQKNLCQNGRDLLGVAEDSESDPSTEFGSDGSESEYSEDECDGGFNAPFTAEDTFLIFDWDDTLLPTTWIERQGLRVHDGPVPTKEQEVQLQRVAEHAKQTLLAAKAHGEVILVTNAERGWVELSCQAFMPSLCDTLQDVKILSARSTYEQQGIDEPSEWKYLAFLHELERFCDEPLVPGEAGMIPAVARRRNVISIGDSPHEREALIRVTAHMPDSCVKAVKLMAKPEVQQLREEHELISGCFGDLVNHVGNLDLCINCP